MLFVRTPVVRRRFPAFAGSATLHCTLIIVMAFWSVSSPKNPPSSPTRKYSVRLLQLQIPRYSRRASPGKAQPGAAAIRGFTRLNKSARSSHGAAAEAGKSALAMLAQSSSALQHRQFKLPPNTHIKMGKQTLVQLDLPPDLALKHEIPLPTALLWTETQTPPPMRRQFVAPPAKKFAKATQSLPLAPSLEAPNQEVNIAELNMSSALMSDTPRLVQPPSVASPVSSAGQQKAKEIPQIGLAESKQPTAANLISLPDSPLRSSSVLALPPANEVAPSGGANNGASSGGGGAAGDGKQGAAGQGSGAMGEGAATLGTDGKGNGGNGSGGAFAEGAGRNNGAGSAGSRGDARQGGGTASAGNGVGNSHGGSGVDGSGDTLGYGSAGLTRLDLPKEGKFGVVVLGSAGSERYPESVGALTGKVVYTVYLKVGLRKSWILQYCLPKEAERKITAKGSATPIDAPWPFLIMRPDRWTDPDTDYIMVRGILTDAGRFDQLAMVFPEDLEKKDWLLHSLKLWSFRPASRDGEPTTVEVLLIIPRQPE